MTEQEWFAATTVHTLLDFVRGTASDRKLRLFALACCWSLERALCEEAVHILEVSERYADGMASAKELADARRQAKTPVMANTPDIWKLRDEGSQCALRAAVLAAWGKVDANTAVEDMLGEVLYASRKIGFKNASAEFAAGCRDIFGNPFCPVAVDPRWQTETVVALATGIYAERAFDRMPILADALEEAGCDHADILNHCRGDGPHVRGCWVVELVLGKS